MPTYLAASKELPVSASLSTLTTASNWIPNTAALVLTGKDLSNLGNTALAQFWTQLTNTISGSSRNTISQWVKPLTDVQNPWRIDLSEDIFSWVKGEYALGLLPNNGKKAPDWILVVDKSDGKAGISHLDQIAASSGLSINSFSLEQQKILAWTQIQAAATPQNNKQDKPFNIDAQIRGLHTTLGNYEIFTSSIATMDKILTTEENSFMKSPSFQNSLHVMPFPNQGYAYLDWSTGQEIIKHEFPMIKLFTALSKPFVNKLLPRSDFDQVSLTLSSDSSHTDFLKASLLLQLEP
ncbi:DUF3352 domain-containing protein [Calothrix rhizosoleniae]|uniref:DUF3352 domain-containing protein n=1 Tax=Calothrix rhizosoleniae TaxID=888997 RepID=UPI001356621C|nr:DUF3352 domain-containing protein [Calothrix rhizosoleniae]